MNNSKIALDTVALTEDSVVDILPQLREREQKLVTILSAIEAVMKVEEWSTLKTEVFDPLTSTLERQLREEAKKDIPDTNKLNRLAGQLKWAEKYSDLEKLALVFRNELSAIRKKIYG